MRKLKYFFLGRLFPCVLVLLTYVACFVLIFAVRLPALLAATWAAERAFSLSVALYVSSVNEFSEVRFARLLLALLLPWVGAICAVVWTTRTRALPPTTYRQTGFSDFLLQRAERVCAPCGMRAGYVQSAEFFPVGKALLPKLLNDLAAAKKSVYLEFYIIDKGFFRDRVFSALKERANAGVDVRVLYDDFGCALTLPRKYERELRRCGIKACAFGKIKPYPTLKINCRNHRKCVCIDGKIAYTGGINLADEYIGESVRYGHWKDSAVRLCGGAAREFSLLFERTWQSISPHDKPLPNDETEQTKGVACIPFCVSPYEERRGAYRALILNLLTYAKARIYLTTPYLAPDEELLVAMEHAVMGGTDVRLLIPHHPDKKSVFVLTQHYARRLIERGVCVREYEAGFLHAKNLVADGVYAVIGSSNLDLRSLRLQYESGVLLADESVGSAVERDFLSAWEQSVPVPKEKKSAKLARILLRPFAPLL